MAKVLLVEDDPALGKGLLVTLELQKHVVTWAKTLQSARIDLDRVNPDLVLLDLNLPDGSGLTFLKELRVSRRVPVLILTAKTDEETLVAAFEAGGNDFVQKPFRQQELKARIGALLRESDLKSSEATFGDLRIQVENRRLYYKEKPIEINRREFDVLLYFVQRPNAVISRDTLLAALQSNEEMYDRTVDSHISHLRTRLRKAGIFGVVINSVYGVGYRLEAK